MHVARQLPLTHTMAHPLLPLLPPPAGLESRCESLAFMCPHFMLVGSHSPSLLVYHSITVWTSEEGDGLMESECRCSGSVAAGYSLHLQATGALR